MVAKLFYVVARPLLHSSKDVLSGSYGVVGVARWCPPQVSIIFF